MPFMFTVVYRLEESTTTTSKYIFLLENENENFGTRIYLLKVEVPAS